MAVDETKLPLSATGKASQHQSKEDGDITEVGFILVLPKNFVNPDQKGDERNL